MRSSDACALEPRASLCVLDSVWHAEHLSQDARLRVRRIHPLPPQRQPPHIAGLADNTSSSPRQRSSRPPGGVLAHALTHSIGDGLQLRGSHFEVPDRRVQFLVLPSQPYTLTICPMRNVRRVHHPAEPVTPIAIAGDKPDARIGNVQVTVSCCCGRSRPCCRPLASAGPVSAGRASCQQRSRR